MNTFIPPDTNTPSELTAKQFRIALCPPRFCIKFPSGNFHCLILSADADAIVYLRNKRNLTAMYFEMMTCNYATKTTIKRSSVGA